MTEEEMLRQRIESLEQEVKMKEKLVRDNKVTYEKEKALLAQRNEFNQLEVKEL